MSRRKKFRQSNWLIGLSPRKNVDPQIVGIRSTFRGSTFFRLVEIRLNVYLLPRNIYVYKRQEGPVDTSALDTEMENNITDQENSKNDADGV